MNSQPNPEDLEAAEVPIDEAPQSASGDKPGAVLTPGSACVVTIFFSLLIAGLAAVPVWLSFVPKYRAVSLFLVAAKQERILFDTAEHTATAFDIYKNTQQQFVKSRFVLIAALRKPEVANLKVLRDEPDPAAWIARNISVSFPGDAEIMEVSLAMESPVEAAALVNAVVEAYQTEILSVEQDRRRERLDKLDRIRSETETELRKKQAEKKRLVEILGSGDSTAVNLKQQLALQRFAALQREHAAVQSKLMRAAGELKVKQKLKESPRERAKEKPVSEAELEAYAQSDPLIRGLSFQAELLNYQLIQAGERGGMEALVKEGERYNQHLREIDRKIKQRREELRKELQQKKRPVVDDEKEDELALLAFEVAVLKEQEQGLSQAVEQSRQQAERFGGSSIDVEMMRAEIKLLEDLLNTIADERQKLLIELRCRPRISLMQKAEAPQAPEPDLKIPVTAAAGAVAFLLSAGILAWRQARARRRWRARVAGSDS